MSIKTIGQLIALSTFLFACIKENNSQTRSNIKIDVSNYYGVDGAGWSLWGNLADSQWQSNTFSIEEINLFSSLDKVDLNGTTTPDSVNQYSHDPTFNYGYIPSIYPIPVKKEFSIKPYFNKGFSGQVIFKYVIVDSMFNSLAKGAIRVQAKTYGQYSNSTVKFTPNIPDGLFRFYYTLSSQTDKHFYKSWGNIEKTN